MIYKIGSLADMQSIVFEKDTIKQTIYHYASVLTAEYGADRNIDTDDGGYILYANFLKRFITNYMLYIEKWQR